MTSNGHRQNRYTLSRQRRQIICGEARRFEDPSRFKVWRLGSCAIRRQRVGVGPADRQQVGAGTACRQQVEPGTARSIICGEARRFEEPSRFNVWRLGSRSIRRQQVGVGPADRQQPAVGTAD